MTRVIVRFVCLTTDSHLLSLTSCYCALALTTRPGSYTAAGLRCAPPDLYWHGNPRWCCAGAEPLPAPTFIAHSASGEFVALGYADAVEVYALTTTFQLLTRIAVQNAVDAIWLDTALFTSTPTTIMAHFIMPPAPQGQQLASQTALFAQSGSDGLAELSRIPTAASYEVQSMTLATNRVAHGRPLSHAVSQTELPPVVLRPGMLWKMLRVTRETLWMVSTSGHAWAMSLRHPGAPPPSMHSALAPAWALPRQTAHFAYSVKACGTGAWCGSPDG